MKRLIFYIYLYLMTIFLVAYFGINHVFPKAMDSYFSQSLRQYSSEMKRGFFHVMEAEIGRLPIEQWPKAVKDLQPFFAYPIKIEPMNAMQLSEADALALNKGEILSKENNMFYQHQVGQSNMVLSIGPIPEVEAYIPEFQYKCMIVEYVFCGMIGVSFLIFAWIWVLPIAKNLRRISSAAVAFGQGAFDARAMVSKRSSFFPMAESFNRMAKRIQELITSHKELIHTVSHELRTPLARIRFDMEMMASVKENSERERHHEAIRRNVDELEMLISELLAYSRFDHESVKFQKETLDLALWLKDLIAAWNDGNEKIRVDCRINSRDPELPVEVNARFLERALRNLLQNAARHAKGRIHVTLSTEDDLCLIHVDDDGPGVAEADRQRIFEPFVRLEDTEERETDGYGLGLSIVRRVAEWHRGKVIVGDASIGGARFTLCWPIS